MHNSKNWYFYHIFVSPGDAPEAITLNIVWMEREFYAYKLSRCMCPSNYNPFWDTARYLWKNHHFIIHPLHSTPPLGGSRRNIGTPFGLQKLEWCRYPKVKKFQRYVYSFWRDPRTWQTDRQTDKRTLHDSIDRACIASRGKNLGNIYIKLTQNLETLKTFWKLGPLTCLVPLMIFIRQTYRQSDKR